MLRALAAALLIVVAACAHAPRGDAGSRVETLIVDGAVFRIHHAPQDAAPMRQVARALPRALPRVRRWASLPEAVEIRIHPTHDALEQAVQRHGYDWLRAWARYDTIDVQSPRTWSVFGASDAEVLELVTHELTHCAMFQSSAGQRDWPHKGIPLWFREGMASVAAEQGYRRAPPEAIWRFYRGAGGIDGGGGGDAGARGDPVSDPEPLYQQDSDVVYAAAHWAFQFLLDRYGEERIREVLQRMHDGRLFGAAFRDAMGIPVDGFEAEFRRYIVWGGWRRKAGQDRAPAHGALRARPLAQR